MRHPTLRVGRCLILLLGFLVALLLPLGVGWTREPSGSGAAQPARGVRPDRVVPPAPAATRYVLQLADPPLSQYRGGIGGLSATALDAQPEAKAPLDARLARRMDPAALRRRAHVDFRSEAAAAYLDYLDGVQDRQIRAIRKLAPTTRIDWRYQLTFNGFTARLTSDQAEAARRLPGVRAVEAEEFFEPELDASLPLLHVPAGWTMAGGPEKAGLGARVAIVDTGLDSGHPFLNDAGMPPLPEGFPVAVMHRRDGSVLPYPNPAAFTNRKVIAARTFPAPPMLEGLTELEMLTRFTPFSGGHGLHVAGIAAGRQVQPELPTYWGQTDTYRLSGVAPMAWVLNYKYDFSSGDEYGRGVNLSASPELIAMLQQMVRDEVDALNLSEGHVTFLLDHPSTHPLAQAFEGAFDAGILVVASAGNAGANNPTALSGAFKYSEKVIVVGNTSATGSVDVTVALEGADRPWETFAASPRGTIAISQPISAPLFLAPDGGCTADPAAAGKIAVVVAVGAGTCDYVARAATQAQAGAVAILYAYGDRELGGTSAQAIALPAVAVGTLAGDPLLAWLRSGPLDARATIRPGAKRGKGGTPDLLAGSSSQGPGLDGALKPDLSAPGTSIYSATTGRLADGTLNQTFVASSGTSMSAPHVAGAAALLRGAHPEWTSAQVQSALYTTSSPSVKVRPAGAAQRDASFFESGAGRLDLAQAVDPGAFLSPPKASFGTLALGQSRMLSVTVSSASTERETWTVAVAGLGSAATVTASPARFTLDPGGRQPLTLILATAGLTATQTAAWGDVTLTREARPGQAATGLRLAYAAQVVNPAARKDVLLVNWRMGDTPDFGRAYTETLDALGLTYDVWAVDEAGPGTVRAHPSFAVLQRYDLVILNTNQSPRAFQDASNGFSGAYHYQNHLIQGGNLLLAGQGPQDGITVTLASGAVGWPNQNSGCDLCLSRYFSGFQSGLTETLKGRVTGWENLDVLLRPHPLAEPAPFNYPLDLSTGTRARDGAAGNQAGFASGGTLGAFDPKWDHPYTEGVFDRIRPLAKPLWTYEGRAVGTYVAGRQHPEAKVRWNAMFWGFGLEGVGYNEVERSASRQWLLGDAFNFLAHNLWIDGEVVSDALRHVRLGLRLPPHADVPDIAKVDVTVQIGSFSRGYTETFNSPVPADRVLRDRSYWWPAGHGRVWIVAHPAAHAAPLATSLELTVQGDEIHLPWMSQPLAR